MLHLLALWKLAWRRLLHEPALTSVLLGGWLAAIALVSAIPMYVDAIHQSLLQRELRVEQTSHRPAFAFLFHYATASGNSARQERYLALNEYLQTRFAADLGLPIRSQMHYVKSDLLQLFPATEENYLLHDDPLYRVHLGFIANLQPHLELVEGQMPTEDFTLGHPLEVLVSQELATNLGLQIGEEYILFNPGISSEGNSRPALTLPIRIVGIWRSRDPQASFWYVPPKAFENTLLVPPEVYLRDLSDRIPRPLFDLGWYYVFDGERVRAEDVAAFLQRVTLVETRVEALLPGTRLSISPAAALLRYQHAVSTQSWLLLWLGLPVVGLILIFITLTSDHMVERQRLEIAILKSRGGTGTQIVLLYLLQGLILAFLALILGLPLGRLAAEAIGRVRQFLTFGSTSPLQVLITRDALRFAGLALILALGATLIPAWRAARFTIVSLRQAVIRPHGQREWQQIMGDLLLLIAAGYGYGLLHGQKLAGWPQWWKGIELWENPLPFLASTLFLSAGTRLYLRLFPLVLILLERPLAHLPGITALLAVRRLARCSSYPAALITLLIFSIGLSTFIASFSRTLDDNVVARLYYQVGADIKLAEAAGKGSDYLEANPLRPSVQVNLTTLKNSENLDDWVMLPVSEHTKVPGVKAATRVGVYKVSLNIGNQTITGYLYGVDRVEFPQVAYFRRDFAPASLGALMNALAIEPAGILVRRAFLARTGLQIGDPLHLKGLIAGSNRPLPFKIVGVLDLFPTAYPGQGEFFVANLEHIFDELGGPVPYYVWLAVEDTLDSSTLATRLEEIGFRILKMEDARQLIAEAQARPERIGVLGFLSLGFMTTALLGMLALGVHAFLVYRQRFVELGVMRALGFSVGQTAMSLAGEQVLVTMMSLIGGVALGLIVSHLFIPLMQIGHTETELIPPFSVIIAWGEIGRMVAGLMIASLLTTGGTIWLLSRLHIFQAIKLGEALG